MRLSSDEFDQLVSDALASLPEEIAEKLENVSVIVEDYPSREQLRTAGVRGRMALLGLYEGVPLTHRTSGYNMVLPDRITIFRLPILSVCRNREEVKRRVAHTVTHEIAHHFGISDEHLRHIGRY